MDDLKVTRKNAMLAKCHDCMGHFDDGVKDCRNPRCSLYAFFPHRELEPDLTWTKYHPRRKGLVLRSKLDYSDRKTAFGKNKQSLESEADES